MIVYKKVSDYQVGIIDKPWRGFGFGLSRDYKLSNYYQYKRYSSGYGTACGAEVGGSGCGVGHATIINEGSLVMWRGQ